MPITLLELSIALSMAFHECLKHFSLGYGHCQVLCRHCTLTLSDQCAVTMRRLVVRWPCTHPFASSSIIQLNQELQNPTVCPNGCVQTFRIIGHWIVYRGSYGPMATANQVLCRHFTRTLCHKCAVTIRRFVVRWQCTYPFAYSSITQ